MFGPEEVVTVSKIISNGLTKAVIKKEIRKF